MSFAQPSYLWALLGLLVPIAIHLWSKKEAKTIKIGSVQLLSESKSRQSSSIQLNEWWLLLLRMAIISLITLVMAKPQWQSKVNNSKLTYIVEPEFAKNEKFMARFNDLQADQEIRLLQSGLPINNIEYTNSEDFRSADYWSLASEMDALQTDSIIVFSNGYAKGLKGARPETNHDINWIVLDSTQIVEMPLLAYQKEKNIILFTANNSPVASKIATKNIELGDVYQLTSNGDSLQVLSSNSNSTKIPLIQQPALEVSLIYADSLSADKRYITAALAALSTYLNREIKVESSLDNEVLKNKESDLTIWLSTKPALVSARKKLVFKNDTISNALIIKGEDENTFYITERITTENAVSGRLTENLLSILDVNKEVKELQAKADIRSVTEADLKTNFIENKASKTHKASWSLNPYLWVVLLVLLIVERFVAYKRTQ
ncbi:N-terminal double-transmembrane domain-containing protein [Maribacter aquivivus]|uniref:N-terminal double-transmembrane domain-containing protein n=1 Tax=Maribacter aquivivus TaxID=228958 RepID=A0A1M6RZZ5_9FLAO|nr:BatA domain-containing protein [Maribacter aquivivus]SHK37960.1 N-terminal double-transmembrane domain-containing protein [Maribacter aquivivus]